MSELLQILSGKTLYFPSLQMADFYPRLSIAIAFFQKVLRVKTAFRPVKRAAKIIPRKSIYFGNCRTVLILYIGL
jgi:hypothetical protein